MTRRISHRLGLAALTLAACGGGGLSGTYVPAQANLLIDKMEFQKGGIVLLTRWGQTQQGTFQVTGNQVTIVSGGAAVPLTIDAKGCLESPIIGKLCKTGSAGQSAGGNPFGAGASGGVVGAWVATFGGNSITLEFRPGTVVQVTMRENGVVGDSREGTYEATGNEFKVMLPNDAPLVLTRNGNQLVGGAEGVTFTFNRQ